MNIVIVDDTPTNVTLMRALVRKIEDCSAVCFTDSAEGLQWSLDNDPDLVIVDYMMPEPDGLEFIRRLRHSRPAPETPVLMVTADHEKEIRYEALERGATDFLTKPLDRIEFNSRVKNMIALRRSHLALANRATLLASEVRRATAEIHAREKETLMRLARAAEFRDPETGAHIMRMAHFSRLIAAGLGLSDEDQDRIVQAAPMHDVGKLGTPDHILLKPARLEPEELAIMRRHAEIGFEILKDSASPILRAGAVIALSHHERYDGSGYPNRLSGEDIPLEGRIVAVADVFDALTSERPYKHAWELERAAGYLRRESGRHFDPRCVEAFFRHWDAVLAVRERYRDEP